MKLARLALFTRDYLIAVFSFLLIFLLTLFVYYETKQKAEERSRKLFDLRASQAVGAIQLRMQDYIQTMIGAKALFIASDTVERKAWRIYYQTLKLEQNYPGMQGMGYAHVIRPGELDEHVQRVRSEGYGYYQVHPAGNRPFYTSIVYLEPFSDRNLRAFGYDMFSEPTRQSAMRIARDTKQPAMSGKVRLVQETDRDQQAGFNIYLPVYKNNADPVSIQDRQRLIKGFVYSPFRAEDLMNAILGETYQDLDVEVYDGTSLGKETILYNSDSVFHYHDTGDRPFSKLSTLNIANNTWRIYLTAKPSFGRSADTDLPYFILLGGSIMSLLMFFIVWSLTNTRRSNRLKEIITDNATAAVFMMDANGYCTFMNPAAEEMTGYTFEEISRKPLHDMIHYAYPDGSPYPRQDCPIDRALPTSNNMRAHEDMFIRKDGTFFNVTCAASPLLESGVPKAIIVEVRDITDEKRAQQAIIESEARFRTMADSAPVMIRVIDEAGNFLYVNKQWIDFTGISFRDTISLGWKEVVHPDDVAGQERITDKAIQGHTSFRAEFRMRRFDGEYRWVVATNTPRFGANGEFMGYISSVIDITEIKEAEHKVKQNAELLQKLFLEVPALVALLRAPDQQYVLANPLYSQLYGNRPLIGKTLREAHPDLAGQGLFEQLENVFRTGNPYIGNEIPIAIDRRNNHVLVDGYFNLICQPLADSSGNVEAVLVFAVEVTELVSARKSLIAANEELSGKNRELLRTNTDLDNFVYTASHDLKSPIANMEGLVALLRDILQGKLNKADAQVLDMVQAAINKLKGTIADLTEITKVQKELDEAAVEPLSFGGKLKDIIADIESQVQDSGIVLKTDFQVETILYARKNLRSIMYNLVSNAIKYKSPDRQPEVSISTYRAGDYVVLQVSDNGLGIKKEQQHKLFSMFKRFHSHVEGTGIGLYIVKRIIENNGGHIEVESEPGRGTTFKVYFLQDNVSAEV